MTCAWSAKVRSEAEAADSFCFLAWCFVHKSSALGTLEQQPGRLNILIVISFQ